MNSAASASLEFSTLAELSAHYRQVRARLPVVVPQWQRDTLALPPGLLRLPAPAAFATVEDIVPSQLRRAPEEVRKLSGEAERVAIRRSIAAYRALLCQMPANQRRVNLIKAAVGRAFKVSQDGFTHHSRRHGVTRIRQIAMCLSKLLTTTSHNEIGRSFGGRDHTTVLHAYRKFLPIVAEVMAEMNDGQPCQIGGQL
ncbi:helix-turn-helix domain-containing protein [Bradyrhizobium embrapense]|uniref:helix-turn-helix domain-containing protein n=1 Tax=Bradyrhizobium embrapense TaxID=630921 RepID=UPI0009FFF056|nr:helix-turn-helix domain-containing protein [Bradyrhizobium embrapense]